MKAKKPHWELDRVKALAAQGKLFLTKTKAQRFFPDAASAVATAKATIADLSERQFAETLHQGDVCDVYGVRIGGAGWYLKITIDDLRVVVSLHPLQRPLRTNAGMIGGASGGASSADKPAQGAGGDSDEMP